MTDKKQRRLREEDADVNLAAGAKHAIAAGKRGDVKKGTAAGKRVADAPLVFLVKRL